MNVLSLFDGMGCAWIALKEAGIKVDKGWSSEIDRHAAHQVEVNFPEVERLGSVTEVDVPRLGKIDLLLGGSPCQNFSIAGKRRGMTTVMNEEVLTLGRYLELKRDGFRFEGESWLFWEYMRILTDIRKSNPDALFLLENVETGKKWERVISEAIGIRGVHINSALVSAQNRKRIYWTNIRVREEGLFGERYSDIPQPEDRGLLLKDVLEEEADGKYFLSDKMLGWLRMHGEKTNNPINVLDGDEKTHCISASDMKMNLQTNYVCAAMSGREAACMTTKRNEYGKAIRKDYEAGRVKARRKEIQRLEPRTDGKTNTLTTVTKDNLVLERGRRIMQLNTAEEFGSGPQQGHRVYGADGMSPALTTAHSYHVKILDGLRLRRLTPKECARLQTVPEWYKWDVSESQQYRMLGNGWTVEVIRHILSFMDTGELTNKQQNNG